MAFQENLLHAAGADAGAWGLAPVHVGAQASPRQAGGGNRGPRAPGFADEGQQVMTGSICAQRKLAMPSTGFRGCRHKAGWPLQAATRAAASPA